MSPQKGLWAELDCRPRAANTYPQYSKGTDQYRTRIKEHGPRSNARPPPLQTSMANNHPSPATPFAGNNMEQIAPAPSPTRSPLYVLEQCLIHACYYLAYMAPLSFGSLLCSQYVRDPVGLLAGHFILLQPQVAAHPYGSGLLHILAVEPSSTPSMLLIPRRGTWLYIHVVLRPETPDHLP